MRKKIALVVLGVIMSIMLVACGNDNDNDNESATNNDMESENENNELESLEVDFPLPETADVGEEVTLEANVTYGDEVVDDADEVKFEYWEKGDEDNSTMVESENNGDGSYTATVTFDEDGIYEAYAHTTARSMHTMPKEEIKVGDAEDEDENE